VYWFSGWRPREGLALGISFSIDPVGAGLATLAAVLVTAALVFSGPYFAETVEHRYPILMLVFLGAMVAFALTGDLFDLFVFFELMSVAAYALTGYKIEEPGPLQGALNFGIINSLGSFTILLGIAMVYARTGALNFAQIGASLARHPPDGLVVVSFGLLVVGLLVKAAVVPFHFWLADAHAVAPPPVCVLFSGVMVELGLYGVARVYWTMYSGPLGHDPGIGHVLMAFGVVTAIVGAFFCFLQQHLKRLLAFSTVSHVGLFLVGVGLLNHVSLGGVAVYVVAHGLTKGALFLGTGIVTYRLASIDESRLRGRGRILPGTAFLFAAGALALAEVPPFGTFTGKTLIEDAASTAGYHWVPWLFGFVATVTAGAVLRAAGRIFVGWGPSESSRFASERLDEHESSPEEHAGEPRTAPLLVVPAVGLLAGAFALGLLPGLSGHVERSAHAFEDRPAYAADVLGLPAPPGRRVPPEPPSARGAFYGVASGAGAIGLAAVALFRRRLLPVSLRRSAARAFGPVILRVRALQSGHAGDYAAWFVVGLALILGLFGVAAR
jgi:multicomponent Na+:H+ antiporter subunit D